MVLDNHTMDVLMRLSYWMTKVNAYVTQEIIDTWKHKREL